MAGEGGRGGTGAEEEAVSEEPLPCREGVESLGSCFRDMVGVLAAAAEAAATEDEGAGAAEPCIEAPNTPRREVLGL